MTPVPETLSCPKGHLSTEADYCSECGVKLGGTGEAPASPAVDTTGQVCPDCGTVREQNDIAFCEVCGYNFVTGAHGELAILPAVGAEADASPDPPPESIDTPGPEQATASPALRWQVTVQLDPSLRSADSPEAPLDAVPWTVAIQHPVNLIGRRDEARGIFPEIALSWDEAVSRRHALLQEGGTSGMLLRDIGAANGTRLNGVDLKPMTDYPVKDGDEITLGHWTRLLVQSAVGEIP